MGRSARAERRVADHYVLASPAAMKRTHDAFIWPAERGSDHCPIGVDIDL